MDGVKRIVDYAKKNPTSEIGVLVYENDEARGKLIKKIGRRLKWKRPAKDFNASQMAKNLDPHTVFKLKDGGQVAILDFVGSMEIKFDAVFLPELQHFPVDKSDLKAGNKILYEMISCAKSHVVLMIREINEVAPIWDLLPRQGVFRELFDIEFVP